MFVANPGIDADYLNDPEEIEANGEKGPREKGSRASPPFLHSLPKLSCSLSNLTLILRSEEMKQFSQNVFAIQGVDKRRTSFARKAKHAFLSSSRAAQRLRVQDSSVQPAYRGLLPKSRLTWRTSSARSYIRSHTPLCS